MANTIIPGGGREKGGGNYNRPANEHVGRTHCISSCSPLANIMNCLAARGSGTALLIVDLVILLHTVFQQLYTRVKFYLYMYVFYKKIPSLGNFF